jgi:hypothetical protein
MEQSHSPITQPEPKENEQHIQLPWNPPTPIEVPFAQLDNGVAFAQAGGEEYSTTQVVRTGYELIEAPNGLFSPPCREWRQKPQNKNKMQAFQEHFSRADLDRHATSTTSTAGYHSVANHTKLQPAPTQTPTDAANITQAKLIADTVHAQVALAMAALDVAPRPPCRERPTAYCWTHSSSYNLRYTSLTCETKTTGHKTESTKENKMGGCTHVGRRRVNGS